ncbi:MAG: secondary thiamine-phosphate synthase enzyme YjbQ [Pirellulaceae bacterium]|jgi:secondary thiamine-phosphate synthase enzyme|nr:secondary thiamine-phosphate synthase enzyme YjbQ [Pirellulaceae bacterium]HJN13625.1 secondary thiamine-phosphate synthase enzyme YjbQ [Pirellulaceae bacterium]
MAWYQEHLELSPARRGYHLITSKVIDAIPEISRIRIGQLIVFIQHTSASLTINENADPDVQVDMESLINAMVPEEFPYVHRMEGPDDMPAHMKASLMGASVTVPVQDGKLALGTWQGIYLCEHRNHGGRRRLILTLHGTEAS